MLLLAWPGRTCSALPVVQGHCCSFGTNVFRPQRLMERARPDKKCGMTASSSPAKPKKALHIGLWCVQGLLGALFVMAGSMKATQPIAELAKQMAWVERFSPEMVRFIGVSELLGGIGLLLPAITRVKPVLTPLAGAALALVMVLAAGHHLTNGEAGFVVPNLVLGGLAAFVAWGRFKAAPIAAR